jgi:Pvc16 N-terminal domain
MALGLIGMFDLSIVTDALIAQIEADIGASPLWGGVGAPFPLTVTGAMPEAVRAEGGCQLSLYLFHVSQDPYNLNTPLNLPYYDEKAPLPPSSYRIPFLPQALDLHYLLTAYADRNYVEEQQAMSVAMRSMYEHPIVRKAVVLRGQNVINEFSVTMEVENSDELGRLWQAVSAPIRLSTIYRASVVFVAPESDARHAAPEVERIIVTAPPAELPLQGLGQLTGTLIAETVELPDGTVQAYELAPAVAAPGDIFVLHGGGLDQGTAAKLFLVAPGQPPLDVTAWRSDVPQSSSSARIELPAAVGAAPVASPQPGVYQLQVGDGVYASNTTPFSISARVDVGAAPHVLGPGPLFSLTGTGFVPGHTEVLLGARALTESAGAPGAGEFTIGGGGGTLDFVAPAEIPAGRYAVRVRVNQIESTPAWWVDL